MNNSFGQYPTASHLTQPTLPVQNVIYPNSIPPRDPYAENVLQNHVGKYAEVYASFNDSKEWRDKIFKGIIKHTGRDYVCIEDQETKRATLILMIYVDYVIF